MSPWHRFAACRSVPRRVFFSSGPASQAAREVCGLCTVRLHCLEEVLTLEPMGVESRCGFAGGMTAVEREALMQETLELYASDAAKSALGC